jgi:hypothetical protein
MTFDPGTIRASFLYNTKEEIDVMVEAVKEQHSCCLNNFKTMERAHECLRHR